VATEHEEVLYTVSAQDDATATFERLKAELAKLGIEARVAGEESSKGMGQVDKAAKDAAQGVNISAHDITNSFNTINTVVGGVTPSVSAHMLSLVKIMGMVAAGAAASSAVAGLAIGGLPLIFAGVGALLVKSAVETNAKLKAEFTDAGNSIKNTLLQSAQPMVGAFLDVAKNAAVAFRQMGPALHDAFALAAPLVVTFSNGLLNMVQNMLPGMIAALRTAAPVMQELANGIATLGSGLGYFFQNLSAGAAGGAQGLHALFSIIGGILPILGAFLADISGPAGAAFQALADFVNLLVQSLLGGLTPVLNALLPVFAGLLSALMPLLPVLQQLIGAFAPVIASVGGALVPVVKLLVGALVQLLPAITPLLVPLINLVDPIVTMIGPLTQLAVAFGQALMPVLLAILPVLQSLQDELSGELGKALLELGTAIIPLLPLLAQIVQIIGEALVTALQELGPLLPPLVALLGDALLGALKVVLDALIALKPYLPEIALGIGAIAVAMMLLNASPIVLAITAVILVVGLLVTHINDVRRMIGDVWTWIVGATRNVADFFVTCWRNVVAFLTPIWNTIVEVMKVAFTVIMTVVITPLYMAVKFIGDVFMWLWHSIFKPVWDAIVQIVTAAWNWILGNVINPMVTYVRFVASVYVWFWQNVIIPVWNAIQAIIGAVWNWLLQNVINPMVTWIHVLADLFNWYWQNIVTPVWNGIQAIIGSTWNWIRDNVFKPIGDAIHTMADAFNWGKDRISDAWNGIKNAAMTPVKFIVDTVYNNGIRAVWNDVAGAIGGVGLLPALQFARGGTVPGYSPGHDTVHAMLSPGEGILVPQAVRALGGGAGIDAINRMFGGGGSSGNHFAGGGVVGDILGAIGGALDGLKNAVLGGLGAAATPFINGLLGVADANLGTTGIGGMLDKGAHTLASDILNFLGGKDKTAQAAGISSPGAVSGSLIQWVQAAMAAVGVSGADWLNGLETIAMHESGGNPNAENDWDSNAAAGDPSRGLMQTIMSTFQAYRLGSLSDNIFDPVANVAAGIRYIQSRYGGIGGVPGLVSMAHGGGYVGYDSGGWLEPGLTLAYNGTGRREAITSPSGAGPHGGGVYIDLRGAHVMSDRDIQMLIDRIGRELATTLLPQAGIQVRR
jgi:SLT domain-containing protein/phage-related protein